MTELLPEALRKWFHDSEEICEHDYPEERDWPCGIMRDHFVRDFGLDAASPSSGPDLDVERLARAIWNVGAGTWVGQRHAAAIAAEYAALERGTTRDL